MCFEAKPDVCVVFLEVGNPVKWTIGPTPKSSLLNWSLSPACVRQQLLQPNPAYSQTQPCVSAGNAAWLGLPPPRTPTKLVLRPEPHTCQCCGPAWSASRPDPHVYQLMLWYNQETPKTPSRLTPKTGCQVCWCVDAASQPLRISYSPSPRLSSCVHL